MKHGFWSIGLAKLKGFLGISKETPRPYHFISHAPLPWSPSLAKLQILQLPRTCCAQLNVAEGKRRVTFCISDHWPHGCPCAALLHCPLFWTRARQTRPTPGFMCNYKLRTVSIFFNEVSKIKRGRIFHGMKITWNSDVTVLAECFTGAVTALGPSAELALSVTQLLPST